MAGPDNTYPNSKVGLEQGADSFFVDADGFLRVNGTQHRGDFINGVLVGNKTVVIMDSGTVLSDQGDSVDPPIIPSTYGIIIFSAVATNMSARMFSAGIAGREITLMTRFGSTQSMVIYLSGHASGIAGAAVQGALDSGLSSIQLRGSAASHAVIRMVDDGTTWNVIGYDANNSNVTLNAE
jgi:hypothetical protein